MAPADDATLSKAIDFLRFPLIMAVVFIHTGFGNAMISGTLLMQEGQFPVYGLLKHIITDELANIAVPAFFFISGFLFFYHSDFSMKAYGQKLKKRARSLLFPYLFWNIATFFLLLLSQLFLSSLTSGRQKPIVDYNWMDWLNLFWAHYDGLPVCFQFWFIRDLMVVVLFSPILYFIIRHCNALSVFALGILWLFDIWFSVPGFSIVAVFFFSFGAWYSINKRNFIIDFRSMRRASTFIYLILVVLNTWLWHCQITDYYFIHNIGILIGLVAIFSWTAYGFESNRIHANAFLAKSSFFVYAYHGMLANLMVKYWVKSFSPLGEWIMLIGYFLIPLSIVGIGVCVYALLHKLFPSFTVLITGGR